MTLCPCCGQPMNADKVPVTALVDVPSLSTGERKIVDELATAFPRAISGDALTDRIYWDDPDGGPDRARDVVSVLIYRLRPKIELLGWTVPRGRPGRGNQTRYRLERLP